MSKSKTEQRWLYVTRGWKYLSGREWGEYTIWSAQPKWFKVTPKANGCWCVDKDVNLCLGTLLKTWKKHLNVPDMCPSPKSIVRIPIGEPQKLTENAVEILKARQTKRKDEVSP